VVAALVSSLALCVPGWHVVPGVAAPAAVLYTVSASGPADAWAAGGALVEHWDGSGWNRVPVPAGTRVVDVAAMSASDAWIVGSAEGRPAVQHWDGSAWSAVAPPPSVTTATNGLGADASRTFEAVAASSSSDVWAVGYDERKHSEPEKPLTFGVVVHWDGATWSDSGVPLLPDVTLSDVSAASPTDVWAVGRDDRHRTGIALHWDGSRWTVFHPHAPEGTESVTFSSIARIAADDIVVSASVDPYPVDELTGDSWGVVYRWDGHRWTKRVLDGTGDFAGYDAAAAIDKTNVWIVDNTYDPFRQQPGTQLFRLAQPRARTTFKQGQVLESLAFDGVGLWGVGWIGSGRADSYDYGYARARPLIMRYDCG